MASLLGGAESRGDQTAKVLEEELTFGCGETFEGIAGDAGVEAEVEVTLCIEGPSYEGLGKLTDEGRGSEVLEFALQRSQRELSMSST